MRNGRPASATSTSPCVADLVDLILEQADDVAGIVRRADGDHRARLRNFVRGGEHRGTTQAVADQNRGRSARLAQVIGGGDEIVHVRRKMRVGELAFAGAKAGKVESQHGNAANRQPLGDALGRQDVLAAGEAVREQRETRGLSERQVEHRRKLLALGIGKIETLAAHG